MSNMLNISNEAFLRGIFGKDYGGVHVTDFTYDPSDIPKEEHLKCWSGNYFSQYKFKEESNQYFTVSLFNSDESGKARRRKALYKSTHVIVLDDVKEKLSLEACKLLPSPSFILVTSHGSEQWGFILKEPCTDRGRVENLLDGLVSNGLAPDGKDPGMKGVTRYVRLPEGYNTKKAKMLWDVAFKCYLTLWNPNNKSTLEELAKPFAVDLDKPRREQRVDGASDVPDHPLLHCGLQIKEKRSNGRFDITCPWVDEHTGSVDNGAAIFTNEDGSIGFKCHHGACQHRTGNHLLNYLEDSTPGFKDNYNTWSMNHIFKEIVIETASNTNEHHKEETEEKGLDKFLNEMRIEPPGSDKFKRLANAFLKEVNKLDEMDKYYYHQEICDIAGWSQTALAKILKSVRVKEYQKENTDIFGNMVFVKEQNRFYDYNTQIFFTPDAFQNAFSHEDAEIKKEALLKGKVAKVDKMDFSPKMPRIFERRGVTYANAWIQSNEIHGIKGNCDTWLDHWDTLGWGDNREHMLKWMAYTILHPENKINHMLLLGGMEGTGKDYILYPLLHAMKNYSIVVDGHELLSNFNEYLLNTKYLHINETELGDHKQATEVSNKLKPLAAAPPETLRVNQKGISPIKISNIVNLTMTTNSQMPLKLNGPSRRFYAVWTDLNVRDENDEILQGWLSYWDKCWNWMKGYGVEHCIWYLRNCVDISDFNPGEAPRMTEFLRSIRESSKSPAQQTVEDFIRYKFGAFSKDLLTAAEASSTLRASIPGTEEFMYVDPSWFSPLKVSRILKDISYCGQVRGRSFQRDYRLWAVRDLDKYKEMSIKEVYDTYNDGVNINAGVRFV